MPGVASGLADDRRSPPSEGEESWAEEEISLGTRCGSATCAVGALVWMVVSEGRWRTGKSAENEAARGVKSSFVTGGRKTSDGWGGRKFVTVRSGGVARLNEMKDAKSKA